MGSKESNQTKQNQKHLFSSLNVFQCEKLEQQKLESLVVTISPDNHWVTGSEKGQTFMQEKWQFVLDFIHFCEGKAKLEN